MTNAPWLAQGFPAFRPESMGTTKSQTHKMVGHLRKGEEHTQVFLGEVPGLMG